jgi:hypothetical protein
MKIDSHYQKNIETLDMMIVMLEDLKDGIKKTLESLEHTPPHSKIIEKNSSQVRKT